MVSHYSDEDRAGLWRVLKIFLPLPAYWGGYRLPSVVRVRTCHANAGVGLYLEQPCSSSRIALYV